MGFVHVHLIPYVHDVGFTHLTNAGAQFMLALVSIAGALLTGRVSDRIGRRRPMDGRHVYLARPSVCSVGAPRVVEVVLAPVCCGHVHGAIVEFNRVASGHKLC